MSELHLCGLAIPEVDAVENEHAALTAHAKQPRRPLGVHDSAGASTAQNELRAVRHGELIIGEIVGVALSEEEFERGAVARRQLASNLA